MTLIAVDYDHTIADTAAGPHKPGAKMPAPMPGALEALRKLDYSGYKLVVFTARATTQGGRKAVEDWLNHFGVSFVRVTAVKDPAIKLYIDDRGMRFESWDQVMRDFPRIIAQEMRY